MVLFIVPKFNLKSRIFIPPPADFILFFRTVWPCFMLCISIWNIGLFFFHFLWGSHVEILIILNLRLLFFGGMPIFTVSMHQFMNMEGLYLLVYLTTFWICSLSVCSFLIESLGSLYTESSSANNAILTYLFPNVYTFLDLINLAKTSSTILNRMGEKDAFVLFLIIKKILWVFLH